MADASHDPSAPGGIGDQMHALASRLYPICRSITGDGVRETLRILSEVVPIEVTEIPSGTPVLDWAVPQEWNVREAWVADPSGRRVVDLSSSNLHVVSYSTPIRARMSLAELRPHLHTLPAQPDLVPYRTSYYREAWGFCLAQRQLDALVDGEYEVYIDSSLRPGALTYGEVVVPGESDDWLLLSAHLCHPSLADDNLSGLVVAAQVARLFAERPRRLSLRVVFAPGTIGAITWLATHPSELARLRGGLTLTCLGDDHPFTYKRTLSGQADVDHAAMHALAASGYAHQGVDFFPFGYDERQYNSPGFRLPVGSLMRGRHGMFPEYHTSADDLSFISPARLEESLAVVGAILRRMDGDRRYRSLAPFGEPQLGRRGLYHALGGTSVGEMENAMLWVLSLSDGDHGLLGIARRSGLDLELIRGAADLLARHALLEAL